MFDLLEEEDLDSAARFLSTLKTGTDDLGVVEHEHVPGAEIGEDITELPVTERSVASIDHEQP